MENVIRILAELLDRFDIISTSLFGYSMGGRTALAFNAVFPDRVDALAVLGATPGIEDEQMRQSRRDADEELAQFIISRGVEAFVKRWMDNPLFASQKRLGPAFLEASRRQRMSNNPYALAACLRGMGTGAQEPFFQELEHVRTPILLLAGALDEKFCNIALNLAPRLQNAKTAFIEDAGHAAHLESPEQVQQVLGRFFKGVSRSLGDNRLSAGIPGAGSEKG
jgi:2-succinyl-6-hydroxy-2,4-cyclohexadiene-1-carboxylate synthase